VSTALYRRYRPDTFSDVIGQEHVTAPLITALGKDAVSHAYLFSGPRGCGKTTSARILARCLNCEQGPTGHPCGQCESCRDLATGGSGSLDVIEIDAASHGGVDDARDLRERATFAPVRDRYKIFIIDEAHMVTAAGFNALLKIVEEPPAHIKFIFATTEPDKVIGTIRSRTHHYPFRLVPPEPLLEYLQKLCEQESVPVAPGVLSLVIRAGGGSVRDTLSVLDQLIAGSEDTGIDYDRATALLGFTHTTLLDDVVDSVAALDGSTAFGVVDRVVQSGQDPRRFVEDLLERLRDLIIVKSVPDSPGAILRGVPEDQIRRMQEQASTVGAAELSRAADITAQALTDMVGATSPRLHLELLMARLLLPHAEQGHASLAARLERLERRVDFVSGAGVTPADEHPTPAAAAAPAAEQPAAAERPAPAQEPAPRQSEPEAPAQPSAPAPAAAPAQPQESAPAPAASAPQSGAPSQEPADDWAMPGVPREPGAAPASNPADEWAAPGVDRQPTQQDAAQPKAPQPAGGAPPSGGSKVQMMQRAWPDIVDTLKGHSRMLWMLVKGNVSVGGFDGQTLTLAFSNDGARNTFANRNGDQALNAAIQQVLGMQVSFDLVTGGAPPADDGGAPKAEAGPARTPDPAPAAAPEAPEPAAPAPEPSVAESPESAASPAATAPAAAAEPSAPAASPAESAPAAPAPEPDGAPAWVTEEEAPDPVEPEPEDPPQPPSPHPAWNGEPSRDPAGVTDSDDAPEEKDPFYEASQAGPSAPPAAQEPPEDLHPGSWEDPYAQGPGPYSGNGTPQSSPAQQSSPAPHPSTQEPAPEAYKPLEEKPKVPVFARKSVGAPPASSGGPSSAASGQSETSQSAASPSAPANSRLAEIKQRMAQRRANAGVAHDTPPPDPMYDQGPPPDLDQAGPAGQAPSAPVPGPQGGAPAPEVEEVPSDDDIAVEESSVFGRRALERLLGATLIEERRLDA